MNMVKNIMKSMQSDYILHFIFKLIYNKIKNKIIILYSYLIYYNQIKQLYINYKIIKIN